MHDDPEELGYKIQEVHCEGLSLWEDVGDTQLFGTPEERVSASCSPKWVKRLDINYTTHER